MTLAAVRGPWIAWLVLASCVTGVVYAYDKWAAHHGRRRVPEPRLWLLCLVGGVAGAWLAFFGLRHKTLHRSFWIVQSVATVIHAAILLRLLAG